MRFCYMKKIIFLVLLAALSCAILVGCSSAPVVSPSWADEETLTYTVTDTETKETVGSMTVVNLRRPSNKTLGGKEYKDADGRTTITAEVKGVKTEITFLTKQYTVLAEEKKVDGENGYTLNSYHSGKYAYYSFGGEEKRINVGSAGYCESEYIYNYIRCYSLPNTPSQIKVADYKTGRAVKVSVTASHTENISVPYKNETKSLNCTVVAITLADTPQGSSIYAYFTPDETNANVVGASITPSKKFPVKFVENDLTYTLTGMNVQ